MLHLHFIEKSASYNRVAGTNDEWTTGTWVLGENTAEDAIGGNVFLHTDQSSPAYLAGEILECTKADDGKWLIHFRFNADLINTTADYCEKEWAMSKRMQYMPV